MSMKTMIRIQIQITHRKNSNIVQNRFYGGYDELASDIRAPSQQGESSGTWTRCRVPGQAHYSPTADLRHHPSRVRRQPGYPAVGRVMAATAAETVSCPRRGPARPGAWRWSNWVSRSFAGKKWPCLAVSRVTSMS